MIKRLRVQNFRKHTDLKLEFETNITIVTGPNGSGKTSLLEAVYIALQGKSWRSNFSEILQEKDRKIAEWWRIDIEFLGGHKRVAKFINKEKIFEVDEKRFARLPSKYKRPTVLFEPNDLQLLYGSPSRRREFFDRFINQINPSHGVNLRRVERILRQRNNLLKNNVNANELFIWDLQFADLSEKIISARSEWVHEINKNLINEYQKISKNKDKIAIRYISPQKTRQHILDKLKQDFISNKVFTQIGPQTHDIKFTINDHNAKLTASRGENRTIIFAVLSTMTKILNQTLGEKVFLLFDDIDSELDSNRREQLYKSEVFSNNYLLATTIKTDDINKNIIKLLN